MRRDGDIVITEKEANELAARVFGVCRKYRYDETGLARLRMYQSNPCDTCVHSGDCPKSKQDAAFCKAHNVRVEFRKRKEAEAKAATAPVKAKAAIPSGRPNLASRRLRAALKKVVLAVKPDTDVGELVVIADFLGMDVGCPMFDKGRMRITMSKDGFEIPVRMVGGGDKGWEDVKKRDR